MFIDRYIIKHTLAWFRKIHCNTFGVTESKKRKLLTYITMYTYIKIDNAY